MAVKDIQIQTDVNTLETNARMVRGSNGTLYVVYVKTTAPTYLFCAYSTDTGSTWTEVSAGFSPSTWPYPVVAIDSQDIVHIVYGLTNDARYRQFTISGGFTTQENIGTHVVSADQYFDIAIDSADNVHVVWEDWSRIYYNKRTAGTWGAQQLLQTTTATGGKRPKIAIDSNNYIYIVYHDNPSSNSAILYLKYTGSWTSAVQLDSFTTTSNAVASLAIDSLNNVHVIYARGDTKTYYIKYTALTDSWSAAAVISADTNREFPTICVDSNDNLNVVCFALSDTSYDIYFSQNTGSWSAFSKILDSSGIHAFKYSAIQSTVSPVINAVHTNIATAGYQFTYIDVVAAVNILRFYSSTDINFPAPQTKNYSRKASASLPATDSNLSTLFTSTGYSNVATENSVFEDQVATDQYSIQQFKNKGNAVTDNINVSWIGKTSIAPSASTVYLQIYNRNSGLWETLSSNNSSSANTAFTLTGSKTSSLTNYYDGSNWVSCRVYQLAV
jgi:hypothetical protein